VANGLELMVFAGHTKSVQSVALSSEGKYLLTGSADYTAKVWDISTGKEKRTLQGHSDTVYSVAISPDCRIIATGSRDKTCKLWNFDEEDYFRTFKEHKDHVKSTAFSHNGRFLLSAGTGDKTAQLVDLFARGIGRTPFFNLLDDVENNESKWPPYLVLHELSEKVSNVQELKLLYSAASATFRAGEITLGMKNRFTTRAFETAAENCRFDREKRVFASLVIALKRARDDGAIDEREYIRLEQLYVSADVFADYRFQSLVEEVRQNTARISALEKRVESLEKYVERIDQDLQDFKAAYRKAMKVKAASGTIGAIVGVFTFGIGSGIADAIGDCLNSFMDGIVDFSDPIHVINGMALGSASVNGACTYSNEIDNVGGGSGNDGDDDVMNKAKEIGFLAVKVVALSRKPWDEILEDELVKENNEFIPMIAVMKLSVLLWDENKTQMQESYPAYSLKPNVLGSEGNLTISEEKVPDRVDMEDGAPGGEYVSNLHNVLRELRLDHHKQLFIDNGVDHIDDLRDISEQNLIDMGLKKAGERNRLMRWIRNEHTYRLIYAQIDADCNGRISVEEFTAALNLLGVVFDKDVLLGNVFSQTGANHIDSNVHDSNEIGPDEFVRILRQTKAGDPTTSFLCGIAQDPDNALGRLKGL